MKFSSKLHSDLLSSVFFNEVNHARSRGFFFISYLDDAIIIHSLIHLTSFSMAKVKTLWLGYCHIGLSNT